MILAQRLAFNEPAAAALHTSDTIICVRAAREAQERSADGHWKHPRHLRVRDPSCAEASDCSAELEPCSACSLACRCVFQDSWKWIAAHEHELNVPFWVAYDPEDKVRLSLPQLSCLACGVCQHKACGE